MKWVLLAIWALMLTGCIIIDGDHDWHKDDQWREQQIHNVKTMSRLELDSDRASVIEVLGDPDFSEALIHEDDHYYILYYRTHRMESDGETTKDETTPLVFQNDRLIGWGNNSMTKSVLSLVKTP